MEVPYVLENGVEGGEVSVEPVEDYAWVTGTRVESSSIYVTVTANDTEAERVAEFTVSYPGITKALEFSITQDAGEAPVVDAPVITLEPESAEVSAAGESGGFNYTIENPADDGAVSCEVRYEAGDAGEWVTCDAEDLEADGRINYTVEANEGEARTAYITVSYPGAEDVEFTISQAAAGASSDYVHEYAIAAFMGMLYEEAETYDNYQIYMSSLPFTAEGGFDLAAVNYTFDVYAAPGTGGAFPEGEYVLAEGNAPNTIGQAMSSFTSDGYETTTTFTEGMMTVSIDGGNYVFDVVLTDANGETHHLTYTGPAFEVGGGDDPSDMNFEISVDNLTYDGYNYSIIPSDKEMSYIHLGTPKDVLVQYGAMTEAGALNEYALHDDVISQFLPLYRDRLVHTGDLTDAEALFPASSSQDVVVLCYGIDAGDNRITPVTTYEFTMPSMPAVMTLDEETIEAGADGYYDRTATIAVSHPSVGEPAVLTVVQTGKEIVWTVNPEWTVSYVGRASGEDGVYDVTSVVSTSTERFFTAVYDVDVYNSYGIEAIAETEVLTMEYSYGADWIQYYSYTSSTEERWNAFDPGTYYVIAIGIDDEGNLTGLYQISEPFEPEQLEASEEYNKWLGRWTVTGSDGVENVLEISTRSADVSYTVRGWQFGDYSESWPGITANFNEDGSISFMSEEYGSYDTGQYGVGTLGCFGLITVNDQTSTVTGGSYPMCTVRLTSDSTAEAVGEDINLTDGNTYDIIGMEYEVILSGDYEGFILNFTAEAPLFPLTMQKADVQSAASVKSAGLSSAGRKFVQVRQNPVPKVLQDSKFGIVKAVE